MILAYNSGNLIFPDIGFAWYTKNKINHLYKLNQKLKKAKCLKTSKKPYVGAIWGTFCLFRANRHLITIFFLTNFLKFWLGIKNFRRNWTTIWRKTAYRRTYGLTDWQAWIYQTHLATMECQKNLFSFIQKIHLSNM